MDFLFNAIADVLAYLYDLTSSFGGSIMLLTLLVMVVVTPLTLKSTRSMIAMQQLQPELRKLQAKYKDDRQKLNEEMMAFYKEHNINPLGGCLPLLVQMPVFIVLYRVLIGLVRLPGFGEDMGRASGLFARDPAGGGLYRGFGTFDPGYLSHESGLYKALDRVREMRFVGLDLADTLANRISSGVVHAFPYLVLVLLIGLTAWYQQRQIQARNAGNQPQVNPQQQALMKIMPFFLPIFSVTLPAGIVLYFLVSNLFRIGQQAFITRTMYGDMPGRGKGDDDDDEPKISRKDTVPAGTKSLFGGLIQLPDKTGSARSSTNGSKGSGAKGSGANGSKGSGSKGSGSKGAKSSSTKAGSKPSASGKGGKGKAPADGPASKKPSAGGSSGTRTGTKAPARKAPARQAPARPAAPSNQNRSKKKKKRN